MPWFFINFFLIVNVCVTLQMLKPLPASRKLNWIQVNNYSLCARLKVSLTDMHHRQFPSSYHTWSEEQGQQLALPYEEHLKCDPYLSYRASRLVKYIVAWYTWPKVNTWIIWHVYKVCVLSYRRVCWKCYHTNMLSYECKTSYTRKRFTTSIYWPHWPWPRSLEYAFILEGYDASQHSIMTFKWQYLDF